MQNTIKSKKIKRNMETIDYLYNLLILFRWCREVVNFAFIRVLFIFEVVNRKHIGHSFIKTSNTQ